MNDLKKYPGLIRIASLKIILFIFASPAVNAQGYEITKYYKELNLKFNSADEKKFEKAIKTLNDADLIMNEANQMYSMLEESEKNLAMSSEYKKAFKRLRSASDNYKDGHTIIFKVFKDKAREFWDAMDKSNHYADRYEPALHQVKEAFDMEKLAIRDQGRAVQIYQDFPVEYNYGWEDDVTLEEVLAMRRNPVLKEPPQDIFGTVDKNVEIDS